jgi:hypothetical protein
MYPRGTYTGLRILHNSAGGCARDAGVWRVHWRCANFRPANGPEAGRLLAGFVAGVDCHGVSRAGVLVWPEEDMSFRLDCGRGSCETCDRLQTG